MAVNKKDERRIIRKEAMHSYDYAEDIFYARPIDRAYKESVIYDNFIFDLDEDNKVAGIEILDYSKLLGLSKYHISHAQRGKLELVVNQDSIKLTILVEVLMRNKQRERLVDIERMNEGLITPSRLECPATV
ncbi:MAG: DUF2283 domain-containing protein [Candidatus Altiarchaeota archaeon]